MSEGHERVRAEVNTGEDAFRYWSEEGEKAGHIYTRKGRTWKRVQPSAALIA